MSMQSVSKIPTKPLFQDVSMMPSSRILCISVGAFIGLLAPTVNVAPGQLTPAATAFRMVEEEEAAVMDGS